MRRPPLDRLEYRAFCLVWLVLSLATPSTAWSQDPASSAKSAVRPVPSVRAVRTRTPVVLDGRLTEPEWAEAPAATGFRQSDPDEGQPASERTDVKVLYDDNALYIGARLFDSDAARIRRRLSRRDTFEPDADYFVVGVDAHHDHLTGAGFLVTAAGSLADTALYNDTSDDESWDGVWDAKVTTDEAGWTAEMRIPFSQLRYTAGEHQTWGVNFKRFIRRKNESDWWVLVLKKESGQVSRFGHLDALDGLQPHQHLDLLPYATARAEYIDPSPGDPFNSGSRYVGSAGVDLKWGLTSNLTLDATVNPDFGQVEVDPAVVNLTAFETFYQEKRPFFLEGSNIFGNFGRSGSNSSSGFNRVNPTIFYSRRIGRAPQGGADGDFVDEPSATTILGAAKLTGKTASGWTVGAIDAVTGRESAEIQTGALRSTVEVEPLTNYMVGRIQREVPDRAGFGVMFTGVNRRLGTSPVSIRDSLADSAYAFGTDGHLFLDSKRDWVIHGLFVGSHVQGTEAAMLRLQRNSAHYFQRPDAPQVTVDPTRTSLSGWDGQLNLNKNSGDVRVNAALWGVTPGFEVNDAGYFNTADRAGAHGIVTWSKPTPDRLTRRRSVVGAVFGTWNFNRENQGSGFFAEGEATLHNYWDLNAMAVLAPSAFDDRLTRGGPSTSSPAGGSLAAGLESDSRKAIGIELNGSYDYNRAGGFASTVEVALDIRPTSSLTMSTGPQVVRGHTVAQYVRTVVDPLATATYGGRYVFGDLDQTEVSMTTRVNLIFTPKASLQVYVQPLIAKGNFWNFKELAQPRTFDFLRYGQTAGTLGYDEATGVYTADPDGAGPASPFSFRNPDFNFKSLRVNAIFRWEWRLGSALYVVWTQEREDDAYPGEFSLGRDLSSLFDAHGNNVLAVKIAYWLTR